MRKRLIAIFMAFLFSVTGMLTTNVNVKAEDAGEEVDISFLLTDDALIGYAQSQTWGVYLSEGYSILNDAGGGKIGWGGVTNAAKRCTVSMNANVERKVNGSWVHVTSWTQTNENALTASVSRTLLVASGYYYRVRGVHYASTDTSSSGTDALWM